MVSSAQKLLSRLPCFLLAFPQQLHNEVFANANRTHCSLLAHFCLASQDFEWSRACFLSLIYLSEYLSYRCLPAPWMQSFPQGSLALFLSCSSFCLKCPSSTQLHPLCFFLTHIHSSLSPSLRPLPQAAGCVPCQPITVSGNVPPRVPDNLCLYRNDSPFSTASSWEQAVGLCPPLNPQGQTHCMAQSKYTREAFFLFKRCLYITYLWKTGRLTPHYLKSSFMIYKQKVALMSPVFRIAERLLSFLCSSFPFFFLFWKNRVKF